MYFYPVGEKEQLCILYTRVKLVIMTYVPFVAGMLLRVAKVQVSSFEY